MENEIYKTIELLKTQKSFLMKEIENNKNNLEKNIEYIKNISFLDDEIQKYYSMLNQKINQ